MLTLYYSGRNRTRMYRPKLYALPHLATLYDERGKV